MTPYFKIQRIAILTVVFFMVTMLSSSTTVNNRYQDPEMMWTFEVLNNIILSEFPEAYEDFVNISFERIDEQIYPVTATFLIRAKYFDKKLNEEILKARAGNILHKMGDPASCWEISVGEMEEYAWHEWEDKKVKKVTLHFYIGC